MKTLIEKIKEIPGLEAEDINAPSGFVEFPDHIDRNKVLAFINEAVEEMNKLKDKSPIDWSKYYSNGWHDGIITLRDEIIGSKEKTGKDEGKS